MLEELRRAHDLVLRRLDELEALTAVDQPDRAALSSVRYQLTRASGARRKLLAERIYPHLLARFPGQAGAPVRALQESSPAIVATSSQHIHLWTIDETIRSWDAYRAASETMRAAMRARIADERRILYPLLRASVD